jgi:hypothetical protein
VLVAVRDTPVRQVWVGFRSPEFPTLKDFVIFWTNVFDWTGQGGDEFDSTPVQMIGPEWKLQTPAPAAGFDIPPGVYRRPSDGARCAMNAIDVTFNAPPSMQQAQPWRQKLASLARVHAAGRALQPALLLASMLLILAATMLWKRQHPWSVAI